MQLDPQTVLRAQQGDQEALNQVFTWLMQDGRQTLCAQRVPERMREDILQEALSEFFNKGFGNFDPKVGSLGAFFRSFLGSKWLHTLRGDRRRRQWEVPATQPDLAPGRDASPLETAEAREADDSVAELGDYLRDFLEPLEVRAWELKLTGLKYPAIQAALTAEFGSTLSQDKLREVIDVGVPRALAGLQDLLDLRPHVFLLLLTEAARRRQQRGQIDWSRGILDVLLAGLEDQPLRPLQAELHLRALHLRAQIALDRREDIQEEVLQMMSRRLRDVSDRCRVHWTVLHNHTQGRVFHNAHKYDKALQSYESTLQSAPGGKPDGTLLRDYGSALRGAGRYDESLQMLRRAADEFLRGGDQFQAARCESLLWRSAVESVRHGGPGSFAECLDQLLALEDQEPGLKEKGNPLVHTQHRLGRLTALAAVPADREKAVAEALQLNKIIDNNNYYRQKFELIELCAACELPVNLGLVPKTRRPRRQKA